MPPKKAQPQQPNKKTDQKKKEKIIEDKTFGLKNKKGTKQQNYIKNVQQQVKYGNQKQSKLKEMEMSQKTNKKDAKKKEAEELNLLFRPVMEAQKVSKGADPKSVVCAFYKQGMCTKGDKCKFSHDLSIQRKAEKRSVYSDGKNDELTNDTMDNWDEDKLKEVVNKKHGESNEKKQKTDIVCKHFIQALEDMKYGWFWSCPTGDKCIYRHALPPGFVLKKDKKKLDEPEEEQISLEELVEAERAKLGGNLTRVTLETFQQWKRRKIEEKKKKLEEDQAKKRNELKQGKSLGVTGRELFQFKPELMGDDDDEADDVSYQRENDDDPSMTIRDVSVEAFAAAAMEVDASLETTNHRGGATNSLNDQSSSSNKPEDDESGKLDQAAAILPEDPTIAAIAAAEGALANGACAEALLDDVEVDEDLFDAELDIDQELEQIDLED